jgi:hypothetical protein
MQKMHRKSEGAKRMTDLHRHELEGFDANASTLTDCSPCGHVLVALKAQHVLRKQAECAEQHQLPRCISTTHG